MTELKFRLRAVDAALAGSLGLPSALVREFSYLQLRMSCELMALSCVIAHDGLTEVAARKLLKEYHAGKIMAVLGSLHPTFFPEHINIAFNVAPNHHEIIDVEQEGMTRDRLDALYVRCGAALHRGSANAFLKGKQLQMEREYADIRTEMAMFRRLLAGCALVSVDGTYALLCAVNWTSDEPAEIKYAVSQPYVGEWPHGRKSG